MRRRVVVTEIAERDVREIAAYISTDNRIAARRFGVEFANAVERIGMFSGTGYPLVGDDRTTLGMRVSPRFSRYTVIYKQAD
ncbi:MAG TPA: type II toxin-antitoxin system RelE/ParE family toxin [Rhizomicrobium sp.]|nr:type II toxin-antitoxin system RelE/ParE family toxin [Rhizomicrobium sp.]